MKINEIKKDLIDIISSTVKRLYNVDATPDFTVPDNLDFGDLTTNVPFQLASFARKSPRAISAEIAAELELPNYIESAEPAGGGFINFRYSIDFLREMLSEIISRPSDFGRIPIGNKHKVQIEYVSANPTGPLNIVSARAAAVGSSLVNILNHVHFDAHGEYYINDSGNQIEMLARSFIARIRQGAGLDWDIPQTDGYHGEYLADLAAEYADSFPEKHRKLVEAWEKEESPNLEHPGEWILKRLIGDIKSNLDDFRTEFDSFSSEREIRRSGKVELTLEKLHEHGDLFEKDSATWFAANKYNPDEDPFVLIKSDGQYAYAAVDIAYHQDKFDRGFETAIDIWGPDHHGHVSRMKAAMDALGHREKFGVIILQQVNLLEGGEKVRVSKRAGHLVTLRELLDDVGVDAARYFFIARRTEAHLDFDLDLARSQSDENPVYYIQYAHARICNILKYAQNQGIDPRSAKGKELSSLVEPESRHLLRKMAVWPHIVVKVAEEHAPHHICFYLLELAQLFHPFYAKYRVVGEDRKTTLARVALCRALKETIALGLSLLGIDAPENM